jgi:hypothetical protein
MVTTQWAHHGFLMEAYGPTCFASALVLEGATLRYEFRRAWLGGVPLPRWLSPKIEGAVHGAAGGWQLEVHVAGPIVGMLVHYHGWIEPE